VETVLIAVRFVHFAATAIAAGTPIFFLLIVRSLSRLGACEPNEATEFVLRIRRIGYLSFALMIASGAVWAVAEAVIMSGLPFSAVARDGVIWTMLGHTTFGIATDIRFFFALLVALVLIFPLPTRWADAFATLLFIPILGGTAWTGHAVATQGLTGYLHRAADVLHLLAGGVWIGNLVPLALLLATAHRQRGADWAQTARTATLRFSMMGIVCVATLAVTGIVNSLVLAGSLAALLGTEYGRILLLKICLFTVMLALAATNRLRLTPRLSEMPDSPSQLGGLRRLARNTQIEIGLGLTVFASVGVLGTLVPGLHAQPLWPLPFRLPGDVLDNLEVPIAFGLMLIGALLLTGIILRQMWGAMIIGAVTMLLFFGCAFYDLVVPAYPTTFYASPTGYSTASIARGRQAFAENCTVCHGLWGWGDGPFAASLRKRPADLTSDHIYAHTDGDLFWWISFGIGNVMPKFSDILDEDVRWSIVDFIRANADAHHLLGSAGEISRAGYPTPNFPAVCKDGLVVTIVEMKQRVIHIALDATASQNYVVSLSSRGKAAGISTVIATAGSPVAPDNEICVAQDENVFKALSLYKRIRQSEQVELLVDPAGSLRAVWHPGQMPDWTNPTTFRELVESVRMKPVSARATGAGHH
jgi:putative copper export protein/mono/diheme cytochrome c family protein